MSISDVVKDVKCAARSLRQSAGFTIAALAALAMGIGTTTAVFSVVSAVLLKPMPYTDADRLVMFQITSPQGAVSAGSPAKFQHWRELTGVVQDVSAFRTNVLNYTDGDVPEQLRASQVSADYFRLLGARIVRGRAFTPDEDRPRGDRVVLLSEGLWTRRFASGADIIGKPIGLNGQPYVVVGIVDRGFDVADFGPAPDVWIPFQLDPGSIDQGHYFQVAGRLKPGVTLPQAQAQVQLAAATYREKFPNALRADGFSIQPMRQAMTSHARTTVLVLAAAVTFVLLIACANVASLLLVRASSRQREMAIRTALGAGRGDIVRQLLTESLMLSSLAGVMGLALGVIGIRALLAINTAGLPRVGEGGAGVGADWRVVTFALVVSVATGVLFGLIPALHACRTDLSTTLKESGGRSGTGARQHKTRAVLVVAEVALAIILLVGSALLIRTAIALGEVDRGFDATNVLTMRMVMSEQRFMRSRDVGRMVYEGIERLREVPGVVAASATCCVPLENGYTLPFIIPGRPLPGRFHGTGGWFTTSYGFFEVFRIPVKRGRVFTDRDTADTPPVAVINEAMARRYWPGADPVNERILIARGAMREFADEPERRIVGVVADMRDVGLNNEPAPRIYVPQAQLPDAANALGARLSPMAWVVRTQAAPFTLSAVIQEALRRASGLPVSEIRTMEDVVSRSTSRQRFNMWLMTMFAAAALLLAAIGIYGLLAQAVQQRTQEIGIRLALGAQVHDVRSMVIVQGMRLVLVGAVIGLVSAMSLTRFIASFLFGVQVWDPEALIAAPLLLSAVALVATWIPASRASRVDPIAALRR